MRFLMFLTVCILLAGCGDMDKFQESRKEGAMPVPKNPEVVAVVGEEEITIGDLDAALAKLPYNQKKLYESSPDRKASYLDALINQRVLSSEAEKMGIDRREDILQRTESYKRQLVGQALAQEILSGIEVSDDELRNYYEKNGNEFEKVKVTSLIVRKGADGAAASKKAESLAGRAKAGEPWENLAAEADDSKSEDIQRGFFPPEIENEIFAAKEGEISGPLEVGNEFYIIKLDKGPEPVPFDEVSRKIEAAVVNEKVLEYVEGLRDKWGVVVYKERLEE
ncbi:MAG: peptidylprolyl isomerase [Candidatus Dadabacteria bacterium]